MKFGGALELLGFSLLSQMAGEVAKRGVGPQRWSACFARGRSIGGVLRFPRICRSRLILLCLQLSAIFGR